MILILMNVFAITRCGQLCGTQRVFSATAML